MFAGLLCVSFLSISLSVTYGLSSVFCAWVELFCCLLCLILIFDIVYCVFVLPYWGVHHMWAELYLAHVLEELGLL